MWAVVFFPPLLLFIIVNAIFFYFFLSCFLGGELDTNITSFILSGNMTNSNTRFSLKKEVMTFLYTRFSSWACMDFSPNIDKNRLYLAR